MFNYQLFTEIICVSCQDKVLHWEMVGSSIITQLNDAMTLQCVIHRINHNMNLKYI